jgi:hypothetical protein
MDATRNSKIFNVPYFDVVELFTARAPDFV